ncbi:MAG: hypothetical protein ACR2QO_13055 [Acidimicrobiales bacterium]
MSESFDPDALVGRFKERAAAVRNRNLPPVGGDERQMFIKQAEADYMDFSIIGDAEPKLEHGVLTLTIDLRPKS